MKTTALCCIAFILGGLAETGHQRWKESHKHYIGKLTPCVYVAMSHESTSFDFKDDEYGYFCDVFIDGKNVVSFRVDDEARARLKR